MLRTPGTSALPRYIEPGVRDNAWTLIIATIDRVWAMGYRLRRPQVDAPIFSSEAG